MGYFVQIFRIFQTNHLLSNDRRMNVEIMHVSKLALFRPGLHTTFDFKEKHMGVQ